MSDSNKENERELLLKIIFHFPHSLKEPPPILLRICQELNDEYCLKFDDCGMPKTLEPYNPNEVVNRAAKLLTDENLLAYCEKYKDHLNEHQDFKGQYYTYSHQTRKLKLESEWQDLEKKLQFLMSSYYNSKAVLKAIGEVNITHDKKWDNYDMIIVLANRNGPVKNVNKIIAELNLIGVIKRSHGDISLPEEMVEFWRRFLELPHE